MKNIIVGLLGFGNVGSGFAAILKENMNQITNTLGCSIIIKKVLVRNLAKYKNAPIPEELFTTNADEIITDPEIDIVVELIGGIRPAYDYIKKALEHHKHVVTANKAVIALYGRELFDLADKSCVSIKFEGSVGGGIPIIATLTKSLAANKIEEIVGIINGTTNYILTRMEESGMNFEDALSEAQAKGFAEANPTSDIEGEDAAYKLAILTHVAFGVEVSPGEIPYIGIRQISEKEIAYAKQLGYKIKLLATSSTEFSFLISSKAASNLSHGVSWVTNIKGTDEPPRPRWTTDSRLTPFLPNAVVMLPNTPGWSVT